MKVDVAVRRNRQRKALATMKLLKALRGIKYSPKFLNWRDPLTKMSPERNAFFQPGFSSSAHPSPLRLVPLVVAGALTDSRRRQQLSIFLSIRKHCHDVTRRLIFSLAFIEVNYSSEVHEYCVQYLFRRSIHPPRL